MKLKIILILLILGLVAAGFMIFRPAEQKSPLSEIKQKRPSSTLLDYSDPAGFTFSYPDNLSIIKNDLEDSSIYADIQLVSKDVSGSLNLIIADSKFKTINDWLKFNQGTNKEVNLGNLKATEVKTSDRLLLGALDQGILFTIEIPLVEEEFWMKVYENLLFSFSFVSPESMAATGGSGSEVIFEGEEVVE